MFWDKWKNNRKDGFTIIEIVVVVVVVVSVFGAILSFLSLGVRNSERNRTRLQAILLAQETMEAVRNFRDNTTWSNDGIGSLAVGANYYPVFVSLGWNIVPGVENTGIFNRSVIFYNVSRDTNGNIESVYNSARNDINTKKVFVTVSWNDRYGSANETITGYIANWRN